jgi:hypothetical protein
MTSRNIVSFYIYSRPMDAEALTKFEAGFDQLLHFSSSDSDSSWQSSLSPWRCGCMHPTTV